MDPNRSIMAQVLDELADSLALRYRQLGNRGDIEELVLHRRHIADLEPAPSPHHTTALEKLATALLMRFEGAGDAPDLAEALLHYRAVLALHCAGGPPRARALNNLGNALLSRFGRQGGDADLEEAVACHRAALALHPPGDAQRYSSLNNAANALTTRFWRLGRAADLADALGLRREALALCVAGHPGRGSALTNLSNVLRTRFEQFQELEDLERAIEYGREALALHDPREPDYAISLSNLSSAIGSRFKRLGFEHDIQEAIALQRQALERCPPGHPHRSGCLNNLAAAITARYESTGASEDLEEGIAYLKAALQIDSPGQPGYVKLLNNLGNSYNILFEKSGHIDHLEQTIGYHETALEHSTANDPDYDSCLDHLANCAKMRFEHSGRVEYLEQAISYHRRALEVRVPRHPHRARSLNNISNALMCRYGQLGRYDDVEEIISCCEEALSYLAPDEPDRAGILGNLASALLIHQRTHGNTLDMEKAIRSCREALGVYPLGHLGRGDMLRQLGNTLRLRFRELGQVTDLEESLALHREALDLRPVGHPQRPGQLNDLGITLHHLFIQSRDTKYCTEAIALKSAAVTSLPDIDPKQADLRRSLAISILAQPDLSLGAATTAFELFESATNQTTASYLVRLHSALQWISAAHENNSTTVITAYSKALGLLDLCLVSRPTVELQRQFLASVDNLPKSFASDAAASAIGLGKLEQAVELLEQGRSILWSKMRGYRNSLEQLRRTNGRLAERFAKVSTELEHLALSSELYNVLSPERVAVRLEEQMKTHRILSEERANLLQSIRALDGFADFLQAVPFATLRSAASEGPVIIVNISPHRSDAIVILASGPLTLVPLPEVSLPDLAVLSSELTAAQLPTATHPSKRILPILRALWDDIVQPVAEHLAQLGVEHSSRIWWCPTSELCALPLHAAGSYKRGQPGLLEMYISSYTPTVSALLHARNSLVRERHAPRLLVVGQPGDPTLPSVQKELKIVQEIGCVADVLVDEHAMRDLVIQGLRTHTWAHFACHGHLDKQPFLSSFELHNKQQLTLLALMQADLPSAELAVLSACHSAAGDIVGTPDETISLAAALLFCGFRSVIGTMSAMADIDGPTLAQQFYGYMFKEGVAMADVKDSARALNATVLSMKQHGVPVHRWIKFVHIGV